MSLNLPHTEKLAAVRGVSAGHGYLLYVAHGALSGQHLHLRGGSILIGADPGCDLVLSDASVSRKHVRLGVREEGLSVEDLDSTNGTSYLGQRVGSLLLTHGARLLVGRVPVDIILVQSEAEIPLSPHQNYGDLLGSSAPMRRLFTTLEMLEGTDAPVLLEGETGTGKELAARAIHEKSGRADEPCVILDCASLPPQMIESELFGHQKGAFTGAHTERVGAFEAAHKGTVFLDEIGELPLELQPKLLRALETGEVRRLGANHHIRIDVRVIAATNRNLVEEVEAGRFRSDLYYRLAVLSIHMPSLRDRPEDILPIARHLAESLSGNGKKLSASAEDFFLRHSWPGNVRELRNAVQRFLVLGTLPASDSAAAPALAPSHRFGEARQQVVSRFEEAFLKDLIEQHDGNLSAASRAAEMDRKHLRELLRKYGLYKKEI